MNDDELLRVLAGRMQQLGFLEREFVEKHALRGARLTAKGRKFLHRIAARLDLVPMPERDWVGGVRGAGLPAHTHMQREEYE